jgi:hypothetical protein
MCACSVAVMHSIGTFEPPSFSVIFFPRRFRDPLRFKSIVEG